jgi:23S rRNA (pseudouridine1915-N3)-methyltransferase
MRYRTISVGKLREPYLAAAAGDFRDRLRRHDALDEIEILPAKGDRPEEATDEEGRRILKLIEADDLVWLLERAGTALSSEGLASRIASLEIEGRSRLTIVIAGTYGAAPGLTARANFRWSLGPLTFLHEWARVIVLEQLYRAAKINRNEPYHH